MAFAAFPGSVIGVSAVSGAENDCLLALWLVCLVYFVARRDAPFSGLATAYLFAPPLVLGVLLWTWMEHGPVPWLRLAAFLAGGVLVINAPQYARNLRFVHTGVENRSASYAPKDPPRPCAVLCLDCAGMQKKMAQYAPLGPPWRWAGSCCTCRGNATAGPPMPSGACARAPAPAQIVGMSSFSILTPTGW